MELAFYKAAFGNRTDKLISFLDRGPHSHVELVFEERFCFSSSLRDGGVRFKVIDGIYGERWDRLTLPGVNPEYDILPLCYSLVGAKYNLLGLLGLPKWLCWPNTWFCSEVCGHAIGLKKTFSPNSLYRYFTSQERNQNGSP